MNKDINVKNLKLSAENVGVYFCDFSMAISQKK